MRTLIVAASAAALLATLPGAAEADVKKFQVTMKQSPPGAVVISDDCRHIPNGRKARLTGTVKPVRAGKKIAIYKRLEGEKSWKLEGTARIRSSGRFVFEDQPTSIAEREYQARMPDVGSYDGAWSQKVFVYVGYGTCPE